MHSKFLILWMIIGISAKPWKIRHSSIKAWSLFDRLHSLSYLCVKWTPVHFYSELLHYYCIQRSEIILRIMNWFWCYCQGFCLNLPLLHLWKTFFSFKCWAGRSFQLLTCTYVGQRSPNKMSKKHSSFLSEQHKVNN